VAARASCVNAVSERLERVRARIAAAAEAAGRDPHAIRLIGVSKLQPVAAISAALDAGLEDVGENFVQEALQKMDALPDRTATWHFIGTLQSNKARDVAGHFDWVHSVDRLKVARRLSAQCRDRTRPLNVCIQVRLGDEPTKAGVREEELGALAAAVSTLPGLSLRGLMCVPPPETDPQRQRGWFRRLRELRDELATRGLSLDSLSMGMSADLEAAVAEGATHLRIGTALFGARH